MAVVGQGSQPSKNDVIASLASAADAARQAYLNALAQNPGADLSKLYVSEMQATALWSDAENKALTNKAGLTQAKSNLDKETEVIRNQLSTLKDIAAWMQALDNLIKLATTLSSFFA